MRRINQEEIIEVTAYLTRWIIKGVDVCYITIRILRKVIRQYTFLYFTGNA